MDPFTVIYLARLRQQELLDWAARDQGDGAIEVLLWRLSSWLMKTGRKIVTAARSANAQPNSSIEQQKPLMR